MKLITSRDNPLFKNIKTLAHSSRERRKTGLALLEGVHLVSSFIAVHGSPRTIAVSESGQQQSEIMHLLSCSAARETVVLSDALFKEASTLETPTGILALIEPPPQQHVPRGISSCVLLEDIQDPGNVGSILRSAAAAGVPHVLMSGNCAFAWSPKVLRAGQGAHFLINIVEYADLAAFVHDFGGQTLALSPHQGSPIFDVDLRQPLALMIGNEGAGLSGKLQAAAGRNVTIPMPGKTESLNVAAAAAICLFEMVRQRR